ncbi:MAG: hypothetical protein JRD89_00585 [Deltaproteobacteria bacterium]|nr:hypothetical protein [Deltaproteobacteria bacterium]
MPQTTEESGASEASKPRRKPEELLPKFLWDILPAYPPYPPLPRGALRGVFGREFEKQGGLKLPGPFEKE